MTHSTLIRRVSTQTTHNTTTSLWSILNTAFFSTKPSPPPPPPHIAIDFGTTNTRVALVENNTANVIFNKPLGMIFMGDTTENELTLFGWKRLLGRDIKDPLIQNYINSLPCKITTGDKNVPCIVTPTGEIVPPVEMLEQVLTGMKHEAESHLKTTVSRAVVAYPLYFSRLQLRELVKAGLNAGFEKLHTLDDPTAAAIAYKLNKKEAGRVFVVIDFGGWSFDISIMEVPKNGRFVNKVPAKSDMSFGGEEFDNAIVDYLVVTEGDWSDECRDALQKKDTLTSKTVLQSGRRLVEGCKKELSSTFEASVIVPRVILVPGGPTSEFVINTTLTRTEFESMTDHLFEKMKHCIESYLKEACMSITDIDEVLLVGGMARVPRVRKIVRNIFGKLPCKGIANLDEAVVLGAAAAVQDGYFGQDPWND